MTYILQIIIYSPAPGRRPLDVSIKPILALDAETTTYLKHKLETCFSSSSIISVEEIIYICQKLKSNLEIK